MLMLSSARIESYSPSKLSNTTAVNEIPDFMQDKSKVFTVVEQEPKFPGGEDAFAKFLGTNIKYPAEMKQKKVQGKVFVSFIVEADGSLSTMKILRDLGYGSGKESVRVLSMSPKWQPGVQNGKKVRVQYTIPISFTLKG
jgi:protein TonB